MTTMSETTDAATQLEPPRKRRGFPAIAVGTVVLVAVVVAAVFFATRAGSTTSSPHTVTINGTLTLSDTTASMLVESNGNCLGGGGYADIAPGAGIVVTNESGKTIGVGSLPDDGTSASPGTCLFAFTVSKVPAAKFYGIQVAHRGVVQVTPDQVADVALTLG